MSDFSPVSHGFSITPTLAMEIGHYCVTIYPLTIVHYVQCVKRCEAYALCQLCLPEAHGKLSQKLGQK